MSKNPKCVAFILIPFRAYVIIAVPFYFLLRLFYPHPLWTNVGNNTAVIDPVANFMLGIFVLCSPILLLGAVIQFCSGDSRAGIRTVCFAAAPTLALAFFLFVWMVAHML